MNLSRLFLPNHTHVQCRNIHCMSGRLILPLDSRCGVSARGTRPAGHKRPPTLLVKRGKSKNITE